MDNKSDLKKYKFRSKIAMRWSDQDELGHVNNALFLTYMEEYRIRYLKQACGWNWETDKIILAHIQIDFINQLEYHDHNFMYVRCSKMGNKSFTLEYVITDESGDDMIIVAKGLSVMVTFDYANNKSIPVKHEIKEAFIRFEGNI